VGRLALVQKGRQQPGQRLARHLVVVGAQDPFAGAAAVQPTEVALHVLHRRRHHVHLVGEARALVRGRRMRALVHGDDDLVHQGAPLLEEGTDPGGPGRSHRTHGEAWAVPATPSAAGEAA
jgi:hypothetical protein